ncbi:glycoprotein [Lentzea sp. NBRC 105346]|uniref:DUF6049 family protein n=1 Tax=Lentzea sp. NBRC 105346 TaxID=3032205 RepID=UPI0024A07C40|nr:DUF6049 family protein [Lentzea sp. NBRC 105346]GLZ33042.1 glycoprotein [Lentzea sp. NBRC 105346]
MRKLSSRKLLSTAAVAGFLFWTVAPATAAGFAQPESDGLPFTPVPATQVWATRQASAQPGQQPPQFLRLEVATLSQRVVLSDSAPTITISGKVVNVGDRKIDNVVLRLERGEALKTEEDVRNALREPAAAEFIQPKFTQIADVLQPGDSRSFSLEVPLRGPESTSLAIDEPGIYPILANVNGKPDFGGQARLAALSTLLPVLGVPGAASKDKPATPAKVTVLWPLADRPRMEHAGAKGSSELVDDELTGSLSVGGRLYSLLQAYESAAQSMSTSLCLAVDPDLLRTVKAMSTGYEVNGAEGKGKDEAALWLDRLKVATSGRCVIALPDADADLVALSRAKLTDLGKLAVKGADVVREVLETQPLPDVAWPEDGVIDQQTYDTLITQDVKSLILDPSGLTDTPGTAPVTLDSVKKVTATRLDAMVSDALQGGVDRSRTLGGVTTPVENQPVSVQNALAALVFRTGFQGDGRNVVIAPPRRWNAPVTEMTEFLGTAQKLFTGGYAVQTSLSELFTTPPAAQGGKVSYPVEAGAREISPTVVSSVSRQWATLEGMRKQMEQADSGSSKPDDLVQPLRLALLRAVSGAWRSNEAGARSAADISLNEIDTLQSQVTITPQNSPILLGSGDSPIPVTITNKLDVRITVRIVVADTPGIRPRELNDQVMPARGERLVRVPVDVLRSGRFSVNVRLTTPDGVALGDTVKLEVSSSAYGTITVVITATAAIALVLLSGRRIYRRVRTAREAREAPEIESVTPEKSSTS